MRRTDGDADHLLVFEIAPSDTVHATVRDEVYLRVEDENRRLSFSHRQELLYDRSRLSPDVGSVQLTLLAEPVDRELEARLPQYARAITSALREAGRLSTGDLVERLGVSRPTVQRELGVLREAGVIEWVGRSSRDPRAYWQLKPT